MRNHLLNCLKLIFILVICFHHSCWTDMTHGYLPVEFFFIVSGYFIYRTYKRKQLTVSAFFLHKCKRIFPTFLCVLPLYVAFAFLAPKCYTGINFDNWKLSLIRDGLLTQSTGLFDLFSDNFIRFNQHDWYLSSLLWGGLALYIILHIKKYSPVILGIVSLAVYSIYTIADEGLNEVWGFRGVFYMPLWRGIAGMSLGALIGIAFENEKIIQFYRRHAKLFNIIAVATLPPVVYCLYAPTNLDYIGIVMFVLLFANVISPYGISKYFQGNRFMQLIPDISLEILLLHKLMIPVSVKILNTLGILEIDIMKYLIFIIVNILAAIALKELVVPVVSEVVTSGKNAIQLRMQ